MKRTKTKIQCTECGVYISISNMSKHIGSKACLENKTGKKPSVAEKWLDKKTGKYVCPYCSKEYSKMGMHVHIWRIHEGGKSFDPNRGYKDSGRITWNKGMTKETNDKLKKSAEKLSEKYKNGELVAAFKGKHHSKETKAKLSIIAREQGLGGVTQSRWIKYNGKTLGSSYELKLAEDLDKNNIKWDTCKRFPFIDNTGKHRTYTPDIYLIDYDIYLDPKNDFLIENINPNLGFKDTEKIQWCCEQNNIKVFVLNKDQLTWSFVQTLL